jgi:hypothetical protein
MPADCVVVAEGPARYRFRLLRALRASSCGVSQRAMSTSRPTRPPLLRLPQDSSVCAFWTPPWGRALRTRHSGRPDSRRTVTSGPGSVLHQPVPGVRVVDIDGQARGREQERAHDRLASIEWSGLGPDGDPRDGGRPTTYPKVAALAYEDDRPDAVSPPTEPSVPARLATSSGFGASRRRTASASCAGDSPVRAAFARSRSSRFSRRRCLADCFSPNNVSRLEVDPQLNRPDRCNSRSS